MEANYEGLRKLESKGRTATYSLWEIPQWRPPATLTLKPATSSNPGYHNPFLRKINSVRGAFRGGQITQDGMDAHRAIDKELYPLHVIQGWSGVRDKEGKEVPFSQAECDRFLQALPGWIFDALRSFAQVDSNFLGDSFDPEALSGNSPSESAGSSAGSGTAGA